MKSFMLFSKSAHLLDYAALLTYSQASNICVIANTRQYALPPSALAIRHPSACQQTGNVARYSDINNQPSMEM